MSDMYGNEDDPTNGGSYLPSLPKLYQKIFAQLGMNGPAKQADTSTLVPPQGMQDFYNSAFSALGFPPSPRNPNRIQRYPDHPGAAQAGFGPYGRISPPNENYGVGLDFSGYSPANAVKINRNINQTYGSRGYGAGPYESTQQYPDRQIFSDQPSVGDASTMPVYPQRQSRPPMYTPPETNVPMPSFATGRSSQQVTDPLQRTMLGLDDDGTETTQPSGGSQLSDPRAVRALDPSARPYRPRPDEGGGSDNAPLITSGMIPSTGRAHMTSPIIPKDAAASKGRAHMSAQSQSQPDLPASKEAGDTGEFLNNDPNDMRPGSLGEARKLFPGRKLQQAIYYTEPNEEHGGGQMRRLGVGADTSKLNPDYIARIWEPADMSGGERFIRGAYETPGKNPLTYTPEMASGGAAGQADKIAREKATPCHVGPITMAVGGRTDHIPMNVLEGSYVLPADIVSGLGEGNTLAGTKLINNMFSSGPFGVGAKTPQFSALPKPSLDEYGSMQKMFNTQNLGQINAAQKADGGPVMSGKYRPVPIVAAGGEYVIHPDDVKRLGNGDMERGHDYLDNFVKGVRKHLVKTLSKLPGPRRD